MADQTQPAPAVSDVPKPNDETSPGEKNKFKVYTRTGDGGSSCLFNMERREKDDVIFEALGEVDEVGVAIGIAKVFVDARWGGGGSRDGHDDDDDAGKKELSEKHENRESKIAGLTVRAALEPLSTRLAEIQSRLMDVGSAVATPLDNASDAKKRRVHFSETHVDELERWIDEYDESLPPLKNFILPGGNEESAFLHMARTAARRAERRVVPLAREEIVDQVVVKYLNRLSDFLYTAARFVAAADGAHETIYCKAR